MGDLSAPHEDSAWRMAMTAEGGLWSSCLGGFGIEGDRAPMVCFRVMMVDVDLHAALITHRDSRARLKIAIPPMRSVGMACFYG